MSGSMFLDESELHQLTARKYKSKQIEWLRTSGIPFRITATGHPVVTRSAVEGGNTATAQPAQKSWTPRVIRGQ